MNARRAQRVPGRSLPAVLHVTAGLVAGVLAWAGLALVDAEPRLAVALGLGAVAGVVSALRRRAVPGAETSDGPRGGEEADVGDLRDEEPVVLAVGDVLDLHAFAPRDVASIVEDWLDDCVEAGLTEVRIVHGKGVGVQRRTVRTILARRDDVVSFRHEGGNWGATCVELAGTKDRPSLER